MACRQAMPVGERAIVRSRQDTIAAISSATGHAARGLVRISGQDAIAIAERIVVLPDGEPVADLPGRAHRLGEVRIEADGPTVPGQLILFRSPASYTGQDLVELHTLGSPPLLSMILDTILALGARLAEPGEFTAWAFLAGKLDLAQAEGVAATIAGQSDAQVAAAGQLLDGLLSRRAHMIRDEIVSLLALVEAEIDFAEEPIQFIAATDAAARIEHLGQQIDRVLAESISVEHLQTWPHVMLVGPPNAGKSSLMNRLTGLSRAICSPMPGTTRDVLTAPLDLPTGQVELIDAAGLIHEPDDAIDAKAIDAATRAARYADLLLVVVDLAEIDVHDLPAVLGHLPDRPGMLVANKVDRLDASEAAERLARLRRVDGMEVVAVSAQTGAGCDALCESISRHVHSQQPDVGAQVIALNARHRHALCEAAHALRHARALCGQGDVLDTAELLATELREAAHHIGTIAGEVVTEELLDRIFAGFCIGK